MTELAIPNDNTPATMAHRTDSPAPSALVQWAYEARQAAQIAQSLAATSFAGALRGKPEEITAAILAGQELGLQPMATLRSIDIIQGTPALRAHAMRGLIQSAGHSIQLVEASPERCVMRGQRKGDAEWQQVEWTIARAAQLGLTSKDQWKKQPQTMLVARATGELCRLIAADVLYAMPYAAEELDETTHTVEAVSNGRVTRDEILGRAAPSAPATPAPAGQPGDDQGADSSQLREMNILMSQLGITGHTGKGSTALNDEARFAWLTDFLGVPVTGSTKTLTADRADQVLAELRRMQVDRASQRASQEQQIGELFDGLDTNLPGTARLDALTRLLGRPIAEPRDLTDLEVEEIVAVLDDCNGQTAAWNAAIEAMQAQRQTEGSEA